MCSAAEDAIKRMMGSKENFQDTVKDTGAIGTLEDSLEKVERKGDVNHIDNDDEKRSEVLNMNRAHVMAKAIGAGNKLSPSSANHVSASTVSTASSTVPSTEAGREEYNHPLILSHTPIPSLHIFIPAYTPYTPSYPHTHLHTRIHILHNFIPAYTPS